MDFINFFFNVIITIIYIIVYFFLIRFDINNSKFINCFLMIVFIIIFPIISVLSNNVFLYSLKQKDWKEWLKISQKYEKIFKNIEIGMSLVLFMGFGLIFGINRNEIKNIFKYIEIKNGILIFLIVIFSMLLIICSMKIIKKIFLKQ